MNLLRLFKKKPLFLADPNRIVEAFSIGGKKYYMYSDTANTPAGRSMQALVIYEEFNQRCTREYLLDHVRAYEVLFSDPKKINIQALVIINQNLKERLNLALFPDHIYKLASVIFFDETESPYTYDYTYNDKKIEEWKRHGGTLDFFMQTPLKDLIPSLKLPGTHVEVFSQVAQKIDALHQKDLRDILSNKG